MAPSPRPKARERAHRHEKRPSQSHSPRKSRAVPSTSSSSQPLSADSLAKLDYANHRARRQEDITPTKTRRKRHRVVVDEKIVVERTPKQHKRKKRRVVSGALLEEGDGPRLRGIRGGAIYEKEDHDSQGATGTGRKKLWIFLGVLVLLLAIIIPVAVVVSNKKSSSSSTSTGSGSSSSTAGKPANSNLDGMSESDIPIAAQGTYLDPFSWYDTSDFNVTYTNDTVGDLPVMGLNSAWDDSEAANKYTPAIGTAWGSYANLPARGVNLGGWLSLEPFITPSLFDYDSNLGIIDEWTLVTHLGASAQATLEKHYATFVTEQTFIDIAAAGLDHVRIPYSYWAVETYDGDPYVFRTSWRYLLRGIEWARKHGLRINLDLHGLPGSQNGWNHSGRLGPIKWLNGTDGSLNAQRSLDVHSRLSLFFAQPRYKNIISFYGLANEPKMTALDADDVRSWTASAFDIVRKNGITAYVVFGDGFGGLANWKGQLQTQTGLVLDAHQYVIFNKDQIVYNHTAKIDYACTGWTQQSQESMNTATGFGATIFAEWSQADTDCASNLNNVGWGNRWEGTYASGDPATEVLSPDCPTTNSQCSCSQANAASGTYSDDYKKFLLMFAEAQMTSFEYGWGWFYWTWVTEDATQWSYKLGLDAGILPAKAYSRTFNCSTAIPTFTGSLPEVY